MKKSLLILACFAGFNSMAQNEFIAYPATGKGVSSTFVTDYHCLGINPANLGWQAYPEKHTTLGTSEFGVSVYSASLAKQDLRDNIWGVVKSGSLDSLTYEQKRDAINGFADDFAFNWDYNMFGASYQSPKFGGIAVSIRSRATWNSSLSQDFSELLFQGNFSNYFDTLQYYNGTDTVNIANNQNISQDSAGNVVGGTASIPWNMSQLVGNSQMRMSLNREFHVGYGRRLLNIDSVFSLYGGIGFKYIQGIAMMNLSNEGGVLQMYSAFSPGFEIDYEAGLNSLPAQSQTFWRSPVGQGYGLDFGVNMTFFNKLHVAASVTNIGSMTYTGNVYEATDTLVVSYSRDGLSDMNIANSIPEMLEGSGLFKLKGLTEKKITLPGTLRIGASLELGKFIHVGAEIVAPFNDVPGSINGFAYGLGGDVKLADGKIILMTGITGGGGYDTQIPMGINFCFGGGAYEVGIASRDAVTFFSENKPTISAAFGFARVRF